MVDKVDKLLPVVEIFGPVIQGEGITAGQRTIFIRFGLCDYECIMCDSMHAVDPARVKAEARWITQEEIADEVTALAKLRNCSSITFSGGNPCIHDLTHLVEVLHRNDLAISLETQGTKCPDWVAEVDYITISPKSPGMGEKFEPDVFKAFLEKGLITTPFANRWCLKVVVFSAQDLEFASMIFEIAHETVLYTHNS